MLSIERPAGRSRPTVLVLALLAAFAPLCAHADSVAESAVSVGIGGVVGDRGDRLQFDQYSGLRPRQHVFGILGVDYYRRNDDTGVVIGFSANDLPTASREMGLRWGRQGDWKFGFDYRELLRRETVIVNTGLANGHTTSPVIGAVAPGAGWDQDLSTKRTGLGFGFSKVITSRLQFDASVSTEHKEGSRLFGIGMACPSAVAPGCRGTSSIDVGSAVLFVPEPIDSDHHQIEARLAYASAKWRLSGGYYGSFYRNDLGSITPVLGPTLLNPIGTPLAVSAGLRGILGQPVALPPDNQAHQFDLTGAWLYSGSTQFNFKLARTRATQNEDFGAMGLTGAPAGVTNLGGRMITTLAQVGATSRPLPKLSLMANLRYEDRDDQTPLALYNLEGTNRFTNRQVPYRTLRGKLQGSYEFGSDWRGTLGLDNEQIDRGGFTQTSAAGGITALRSKTDETTWRAELRKRMNEDLSGTLVLQHGRRTGSNWLRDNSGLGVTEVSDTGAPGTGFDRGIFMPTLADRERDKVRLYADWQPTEALAVQVAAEVGHDRYHTPSAYGVRKSGLHHTSLDLSYAITDAWNLTSFFAFGRQELDQARPDAAFMSFRNSETSFGLGVNGKASSKLEVGANLGFQQDRSTFSQSPDTTTDLANLALLQASGGLPDITFRQYSLKVFGKYTIDKQSSVRAEVAYFRTRWNDWAWGYNGTPFVYSDGTVVTRQAAQNVTLMRVVYTYRWQ